MVAAARELPVSGYALEIDGRLKAEFATRDGAKAGAEELKKRFPMLQVRIYDAVKGQRGGPASARLNFLDCSLWACASAAQDEVTS